MPKKRMAKALKNHLLQSFIQANRYNYKPGIKNWKNIMCRYVLKKLTLHIF